MALISLSLLFLPKQIYPKGASPLVFDALLLLALPFELTLQKLVELLELGERSHQLAALKQNITAILIT
jgi:hypothetical protein